MIKWLLLQISNNETDDCANGDGPIYQKIKKKSLTWTLFKIVRVMNNLQS